MTTNETQKGFVLGEAVRDTTTGQTMYVEKAWSPTVPCIYFDPKTESLVKVDLLPENLERIKEILPYLPK